MGSANVIYGGAAMPNGPPWASLSNLTNIG